MCAFGFFFLLSQLASPHVQSRDFIYSTSYIILQELEENFSSLNIGFVPTVSQEWFKHGWQVKKSKSTDLKKTLQLLEQRKSADCSEFRPQTGFAREKLSAFYCYAALSKGKGFEWLLCSLTLSWEKQRLVGHTVSLMASMALAQGVLFHLMSYVSDTSGIAEVILF